MNSRVIPLSSFDRAAHLRQDLDALEAMLASADSLLLPVWRDQTLTWNGDVTSLCVVPVSEARHWIDQASELCFLGLIDGRAAFTIDLSNVHEPFSRTTLATQATFQQLLAIGGQLGEAEAGIAAFSRAIFHWHRQHLHCGACGAETRPREGGHCRQCSNTECGTKHFPRTDPAIIVLVTRGDRCLLGHQRGWPTGMYSTLAGFVEPGETLEQAVVREVKEEAGVTVTDVRYWKSQPWPFPSSLMLAFHATAVDDAIAVDGTEIESAHWYTREQLLHPGDTGFFFPPPYSVAGQLIRDFIDRDSQEGT
jgi:NAD+ diphosphatase